MFALARPARSFVPTSLVKQLKPTLTRSTTPQLHKHLISSMSTSAQASEIQPPLGELVVRDLDSVTTIFSAPFQRGPIPFGGRSTAITLQSGDVWVIASTPLDQVTADKLISKGPVKYIVAPDAE